MTQATPLCTSHLVPRAALQGLVHRQAQLGLHKGREATARRAGHTCGGRGPWGWCPKHGATEDVTPWEWRWNAPGTPSARRKEERAPRSMAGPTEAQGASSAASVAAAMARRSLGSWYPSLRTLSSWKALERRRATSVGGRAIMSRTQHSSRRDCLRMPSCTTSAGGTHRGPEDFAFGDHSQSTETTTASRRAAESEGGAA